MPTLTIWCRYPDDPNDDELTSVVYAFGTVPDAESARDAILELVRAGGEFTLPDDEIGPAPFHAATVWRITIEG